MKKEGNIAVIEKGWLSKVGSGKEEKWGCCLERGE